MGVERDDLHLRSSVVGQQRHQRSGGEKIRNGVRGAQPQSESGSGSCAHYGNAGGDEVARHASAHWIAGRIDEMKLGAWRREQRLKLRLFSLFGLLLRCPFHAADGIDWFWRLRRRRLQCRRALPHVFEMPLARHRLDEEVAHRPDQRIDPIW